LRRHNHLGLAIGLLSALAKVSVAQQAASPGSDSLWDKTVEDAKVKMKERVERRREMLAMAGKGGKGLPPGALDGMDMEE
jgi:hypothetical protein